jgi:hypothetical protein
MSQNRNKLMDLLAGNISNLVVHSILEKAISKREIADKYRKELVNSLEIAKKYREKINPIDRGLSIDDIKYLKNKILNRVKSELMVWILKGYSNIGMSLVESETDKRLKELSIE